MIIRKVMIHRDYTTSYLISIILRVSDDMINNDTLKEVEKIIEADLIQTLGLYKKGYEEYIDNLTSDVVALEAIRKLIK